MKLTSEEMCKFSGLPTPWGVDHELIQAVCYFYCPLLKVATDSWCETLSSTVFKLALWYLCFPDAINMSLNAFLSESMNNTTQTFELLGQRRHCLRCKVQIQWVARSENCILLFFFFSEWEFQVTESLICHVPIWRFCSQCNKGTSICVCQKICGILISSLSWWISSYPVIASELLTEYQSPKFCLGYHSDGL